MAKSVVKPPAKWWKTLIFRPNDGDFGVMKFHGDTHQHGHQIIRKMMINPWIHAKWRFSPKNNGSIAKKKHQSYPSASSYHPGEKGQNAIILIIAGLVYIPFYTKLISFLSRRVSNPGSSDQSILISRDYLHLSPILMLQRTHPKASRK